MGQKLTKWNDELFMQFYSSTHFYPDVRIVWKSEGMRYQSTFEEWAKLINALEAIIKVLLLYFFVHDNCLLFML